MRIHNPDITGSLQVSSSASSEHYIIGANVGIGITNPTQKLHIGSRGTGSDPATTASDGLVFDFYNAGNPYPRKGSIISNSADTSEARLSFWTTASSSSASEKMTIDGLGNVGRNE